MLWVFGLLLNLQVDRPIVPVLGVEEVKAFNRGDKHLLLEGNVDLAF